MLQPMMNTYMDTRGLNADNPAFSDVIVKGIAPGGGLFVPRDIPHLTLDDLKALAPLSYPQRAAAIYKAFGVDFPDQQDQNQKGQHQQGQKQKGQHQQGQNQKALLYLYG